MTNQRELYEAAVVERLKESGFLEIEVRTECLVRCDDGYQDEVINAGWHYWNAAIAAQAPATSSLEHVQSYMTADEIQHWISGIHNEPAKEVLRDYLRLCSEFRKMNIRQEPIGYISRQTFAELVHDNSGEFEIVTPHDLMSDDLVPIYTLPGAHPSDPSPMQIMRGSISELDDMVASAIEAAIETSPEFNHGWRSMSDKELIPEILDEIPDEYTEKDIAEAIYRYKVRRLSATEVQP